MEAKYFDETLDFLLNELKANASRFGIPEDYIKEGSGDRFEISTPTPYCYIFGRPAERKAIRNAVASLDVALFIGTDATSDPKDALRDAVKKAGLILKHLIENQDKFDFKPDPDLVIEYIETTTDRTIIAINGSIPFRPY